MTPLIFGLTNVNPNKRRENREDKEKTISTPNN